MVNSIAQNSILAKSKFQGSILVIWWEITLFSKVLEKGKKQRVLNGSYIDAYNYFFPTKYGK